MYFLLILSFSRCPGAYCSSIKGNQSCNGRKSHLSKSVSYVPNERLTYKLEDVVLKNPITKFIRNCIFVLKACVLSTMLPMVQGSTTSDRNYGPWRYLLIYLLLPLESALLLNLTQDFAKYRDINALHTHFIPKRKEDKT